MAVPAPNKRILRIVELSKSREGVPVLERIGFEAAAGRSCGIIGDDREALAAFIAILSGAEDEDSGLITLETGTGKALRLDRSERLARVGVARERPRLVEKLRVLDNVYLGNAGRCSRFGIVNESAMRRNAAEYLRLLDARISVDAPLRALDNASRSLVDVARVLAKDPDCILFDSVTRAMNARQYEAFTTAYRSLKARGKALMIVPVGAEDVRSLVDRLYLLTKGHIKEIEDPASLREEDLNALFLHGDKRGLQHINDPVYRARMRIEELVGEGDIDFKEIAASVFMSYDNFRRKFKLQAGLSPNQYFIRLKVDRAKELLLFTDLEIKEIAEKLGFSDPYYFSRVFKEWEGLSPIRFRGKKAS